MIVLTSPQGVPHLRRDRVRLGAHLADGTTVWHEGLRSTSPAGTLGTSMVEACISAGVVVGLTGSGHRRRRVHDGTLSVAARPITIGGVAWSAPRRASDRARDDASRAGLYVTAASAVTMPDPDRQGPRLSRRLKPRRRNSGTGTVEPPNNAVWGGLTRSPAQPQLAVRIVS